MLWNLSLALRALGRDSEAHAVNRHALKLPADPTSPHELLLAFDDATHGAHASAVKRLETLNREMLRPYDKFFDDLVRALLAALGGKEEAIGNGENHAACAQGLERLMELKKEYPQLWNDAVQRRATGAR
jgi:hypothetical protein